MRGGYIFFHVNLFIAGAVPGSAKIRGASPLNTKPSLLWSISLWKHSFKTATLMWCDRVAQLCLKPGTGAMPKPLHLMYVSPLGPSLTPSWLPPLLVSSKHHRENLALVVPIPFGIVLDQVLLFSKYSMKTRFLGCPYPHLSTTTTKKSARRNDLPSTHIFSEHHGSWGFTIYYTWGARSQEISPTTRWCPWLCSKAIL